MTRTAGEIIALIKERIAGCDFAEEVATADYFAATTDNQKQAAVNLSQIACGQRNVLQTVLDEASNDND